MVKFVYVNGDVVLLECYWCYVKCWEWFGYLVFFVMLIVYFLMVVKLM